MLRLIGLSGEARCGKSSAAGFLCRELGFEAYALSSPIKAMINALFDWDERHSEGELKETLVEVPIERKAFYAAWNECGMPEVFGLEMDNTAFGDMLAVIFQDDRYSEAGPMVSPRRAYQLFGTEYGRGRKPTIWLDLAKYKLNSLPDDSGMVVTDVRFPNEHKWIARNGGFLVHVRRKGSSHVISDSAHESEAGLKRMAMDWVTPECENLEQLEAAMKKVSGFAEFAEVQDVRMSPKMPSFEQVYGDKANG